MPPTIESLGLDRLPHSDRLAVAQALWDSVAAESAAPVLSDARRQELRRRAAEDDAAPWPATLAELLAGITPENLHGELLAGSPAGRELL